MEQWLTIEEFPTYEVSDRGQVANLGTGRILKQTLNHVTGLYWVGLRKHLQQHTRSTHRLVAEAFLHPAPGPAREFVPVHINGDKSDNRAENLVWKSLSFSRELNNQRTRSYPLSTRTIRCIETGELFEDSREAAEAVDGLERYIVQAAGQGSSMSYRGYHWEFSML